MIFSKKKREEFCSESHRHDPHWHDQWSYRFVYTPKENIRKYIEFPLFVSFLIPALIQLWMEYENMGLLKGFQYLFPPKKTRGKFKLRYKYICHNQYQEFTCFKGFWSLYLIILREVWGPSMEPILLWEFVTLWNTCHMW